MPNTSPSQSILKKLGFNLPTPDKSIDVSNQDEIAKQTQSKQPLWKQYARNAVEAPVGALKGYLGMGVNDDASSGEYVANKLFQQNRDPDPYLSSLTKDIPGMTGDIAQGISIFPNASARRLSTAAFREAADDAPKNIGIALNEFANRYPRISAHMSPRAGESVLGAKAAVELPPGVVKQPLLTKFTQAGKESAANNLNNARNMVFHEGTHVAQGLGNKDMNQLYNNANILTNYEDIPHEINARYSAAKSSNLPSTNKVNINQSLNDLSANQLSSADPNRVMAAQKIQDILKRRGQLKPIQSAYGNQAFDNQLSEMEKGLPSFQVLKK